MSRSGYSDDYDEDYNNAALLYMQTVENAIHGKRGQKFIRDLITSLDALPEKKLIHGALECQGQVCALGSVGKARGIDMSKLDTYDRKQMADTFGIASCMAGEIMFQNDDDFRYCGDETDEQRWARVRGWAVSQLVKTEHTK